MTGDHELHITDSHPSGEHQSALPLLVYDWFASQFPVWKPDLNPKYQTRSQSLTEAMIPEAAWGPTGMVFYKSVLDPLWSPDDLVFLKDTYPWVLLILSPFERFFELDTALDKLSAASSRLVVWRPDRPAPEETARLRVAAIDAPVQRNPAPGRQNGQAIHEIFHALYVERGILIVQGVRHLIAQGMGGMSMQQYVSACLMSLVPSAQPRPAPPHHEMLKQALHWAEELCGQNHLAGLEPHAAGSQVSAWAAVHLNVDHGILSGELQLLPELFLTHHFQEEARWFDASLERVRHVLQSLRRNEMTFVQAMTQVSQTFKGDEARLARWKRLVEDVPGFLRWLPSLGARMSYLGSAFAVSEPRLEGLKENLLKIAAEPRRFLEAAERDRFDEGFEEFKQAYCAYYEAAHEDTVHIVGDQERLKTKVDSVALRNLELLSDLPFAERSYLNRVKAVGKYLQAAQCDLPVGEILVSQPRCYCNFNPELSRQLRCSVDQMNEALHQGIDWFRSMLRKCRLVIIQELKALGADDQNAKQIAALLSNGPMIPLRSQSIGILHSIMQKHARVFRTASNRPRSADGRPQGSRRG